MTSSRFDHVSSSEIVPFLWVVLSACIHPSFSRLRFKCRLKSHFFLQTMTNTYYMIDAPLRRTCFCVVFAINSIWLYCCIVFKSWYRFIWLGCEGKFYGEPDQFIAESKPRDCNVHHGPSLAVSRPTLNTGLQCTSWTISCGEYIEPSNCNVHRWPSFVVSTLNQATAMYIMDHLLRWVHWTKQLQCTSLTIFCCEFFKRFQRVQNCCLYR